MSVPERLRSVCQFELETVRSRVLAEPLGEVVFAHAGTLSHEDVAALLAVAEGYAQAREDGVALRKRLISVLVEGLENVHHHALEVADHAAFAILLRSAEGYRFAFGNGVHLAVAMQLEQRLLMLGEMDEVGLKEQYLKLLANDARSSHGGAGLGLLTLARRCGRPIVPRITPVGDDMAFFSLELRVPVG